VCRLYDQNRLAELCELYVDIQIELPDQAHLQLCKLLSIAKYVGLQPTRAHRLMAFLACEGLLPEVITTNYDCCLELAYAEACGHSIDLAAPSKPKASTKC